MLDMENNPTSTLVDAHLEQTSGDLLDTMVAQSAHVDRPPASGQGDAARQLDVVIDGRRVTIVAQNELELRCGDAAIILSADGRIELRGTYITSHASATQRILGGSVNVN